MNPRQLIGLEHDAPDAGASFDAEIAIPPVFPEFDRPMFGRNTRHLPIEEARTGLDDRQKIIVADQYDLDIVTLHRHLVRDGLPPPTPPAFQPR